MSWQFFTPDDRDYLVATVRIKVYSDQGTIATGDGQYILPIDEALAGLNLVSAHAFVTTASSSGLVTVQIRNVTQAADMLSTAITIDASETSSYTAATPPVIDTNNDDVALADLVAVDVDTAGTGAKGLYVVLRFGE
jgi:hypothetical protein